MDKNFRFRYPGVRPFQASDEDLFFGRDRDIADLLDLVQLEKLVVLFSRSGYGKSSLIHAGLLPAIDKENAGLNAPMNPIEIRLSFDENTSSAPLDLLLNRLEKDHAPAPDSDFLDDLVPRRSLWYHFKKRQPAGKSQFLLIFDQFEEFFYFPQEQQEQFCEQLAELLYKTIPQDVRDRSENCTPEQQQFLTRRCEVKVLFAIRSDRLDALDSLKTWLPAILHKRFELKALNEQQARQAITQPAGLSTPTHFSSPPFVYDAEALEKIIYELSGGQKDGESVVKIESFQLQIVCDYLETKARLGALRSRNSDGLLRVTPADLPDFLTVYEDYYKQKIAEMPPAQRHAAQLVVEDGLLFINERTGFARRRTRGADELVQEYEQAGVTEALIHALEQSYVLRREINALGEFNYEISHDTLIAPVLKARREREEVLLGEKRETERLEAEQRAIEAEARAQAEALRREEAERLQKMAEKARQRAARLALGAALLAVVAIGSSVFAWINSREAEKQRAVAVSEKANANASAQVAIEKTVLAESARTQADSNLRRAQVSELRAIEALEQVKQEKNATEAERVRAEENFRMAQQKKREAEESAQTARLALEKIEMANDKIVDGLLAEAEQDIGQVNYEGARARLDNAVELGRRAPAVARVLLELAFFHNESGRWQQAQGMTGTAARLLDHPQLALEIESAAGTGLADQLRQWQRQLAPDRFAALEYRYYPDLRMQAVPGGVFPAKPGVSIPMADFRMSATETTVWQYNLFLSSQGKDIRDEKNTIPSPGWGWNGPDPVVYVSWFDALRYANWLSARRGLAPAYQIAESGNNPGVQWLGGPGFRLPTEAEWEYAAGGGVERDSFLYAGSNEPEPVAWFSGNSSNRAHPVAQKQPNRLGLYDMSGNTSEWCWNWYIDNYPLYLLTDPRGPEQGTSKVVRGGAFSQEFYCRITRRDYKFPSERQEATTFRLVSQ